MMGGSEEELTTPKVWVIMMLTKEITSWFEGLADKINKQVLSSVYGWNQKAYQLILQYLNNIQNTPFHWNVSNLPLAVIN